MAWRTDSPPTLDDLIRELLDEERTPRIAQGAALTTETKVNRNNDGSNNDSKKSHRFGQRNGQKRSRNRPDTSAVQCSVCKLDHEEDRCYYLIPRLRPSWWKPRPGIFCVSPHLNQTHYSNKSNTTSNTNSASTGEPSNSTVGFTVMLFTYSTHTIQASPVWIVDTGADYHVSNYS